MKKFDYIRLSHSTANQKIWNAIVEKYISINRKNRFAGFVWITLACIVFGFIAVSGWFSFITVFFKDIRFSQHYMRTVITIQGMTAKQTGNYLDSCLLSYKNCLSYGHIPAKEQKRIEATFDILYEEFGISQPDISDNIQSLTHIASENNRELKAISTYTTWKQTVEKNEIERKRQSYDEQAKRKISAQNRAKGRMLASFEPDLTDEQLGRLVNCCNIIQIFIRDIEVYELEDILSCSHDEPLPVNINKHLAVLFDKLREHRLICKTWMSVAERYDCFVSKQGKPIASKDLSSALSAASLIKPDIEDRIKNCVNAIAELNIPAFQN